MTTAGNVDKIPSFSLKFRPHSGETAGPGAVEAHSIVLVYHGFRIFEALEEGTNAHM